MVNKRTEENWKRLKEEIKIGDVIHGTVFKVEPYGVYVNIKKDFYGIVLAPQIGRENITQDEFPKVGEIIKTMVLGFSDFSFDYTYVSLSIKKLN